MSESLNFAFQPRWKEELVCRCDAGVFVLEMPMGKPCVMMPTEDAWREKAPAWAKDHYKSFFDQLVGWCQQEKLPYFLDSSACIDPEES